MIHTGGDDVGDAGKYLELTTSPIKENRQ